MIDIVLNPDELSDTTGTITEWLKSENDLVRENELILVVETNKVSLEVVCPVTGILGSIYKSVGECVTASDVLGTIIPQAILSNERQNPSTPSYDQNFIRTSTNCQSPAVRRLLREYKIEAAEISASGKSGRLTKADVISFLADADKNKISNSNSRVYPFTERQRTAAQAITSSINAIPHVTVIFELDLTSIITHRKSLSGDKQPPSITAYLVECIKDILPKYPILNGHYSSEGVISFEAINVGIVTSLPNHDLMIPVIKNCNAIGVSAISDELKRLRSAALSGVLSLSDVRDATFCISNYGVSGALLATPIVIPQPLVAILGIGKMAWKQKFDCHPNGIESRVYAGCYITLTIDHRVINGSLANAFMVDLIARIEHYNRYYPELERVTQ